MIRHRDSFCKVTPLPMSFLSLLFLALLQGLTEFLPVSSSAHLKLFHLATGTEANALVLDVAVHIGTMAAVCLYFWPRFRPSLSVLRSNFPASLKSSICSG